MSFGLPFYVPVRYDWGLHGIGGYPLLQRRTRIHQGAVCEVCHLCVLPSASGNYLHVIVDNAQLSYSVKFIFILTDY